MFFIVFVFLSLRLRLRLLLFPVVSFFLFGVRGLAPSQTPAYVPLNTLYSRLRNIYWTKQSCGNAIKWTKYFSYSCAYAWKSIFILHVGYLCQCRYFCCWCRFINPILLSRISLSWQNIWVARTSGTYDFFFFFFRAKLYRRYSVFGFFSVGNRCEC